MEDLPENQNQFLDTDFNVDGHGDIFGDFADYSVRDWGMDIDASDEDDPTQDGFDVEDEDLYVVTMAEEEFGMEPERAPHSSSPASTLAQSSPTTDSKSDSMMHSLDHDMAMGKALRL